MLALIRPPMLHDHEPHAKALGNYYILNIPVVHGKVSLVTRHRLRVASSLAYETMPVQYYQGLVSQEFREFNPFSARYSQISARA